MRNRILAIQGAADCALALAAFWRLPALALFVVRGVSVAPSGLARFLK